MTYFPDLSPYAYGHDIHEGVVHVGWLDNTHPFPKGHVARNLIDKMKVLATKPVELYRGYHYCEICIEPPGLVKTFLSEQLKVIDPSCSWAKWMAQHRSNGEIRVDNQEVIFAAPVLIVHYIEEHGYLPPPEFLKALENIPFVM
jgi:hypothetical protein